MKNTMYRMGDVIDFTATIIVSGFLFYQASTSLIPLAVLSAIQFGVNNPIITIEKRNNDKIKSIEKEIESSSDNIQKLLENTKKDEKSYNKLKNLINIIISSDKKIPSSHQTIEESYEEVKKLINKINVGQENVLYNCEILKSLLEIVILKQQKEILTLSNGKLNTLKMLFNNILTSAMIVYTFISLKDPLDLFFTSSKKLINNGASFIHGTITPHIKNLPQFVEMFNPLIDFSKQGFTSLYQFVSQPNIQGPIRQGCNFLPTMIVLKLTEKLLDPKNTNYIGTFLLFDTIIHGIKYCTFGWLKDSMTFINNLENRALFASALAGFTKYSLSDIYNNAAFQIPKFSDIKRCFFEGIAGGINFLAYVKCEPQVLTQMFEGTAVSSLFEIGTTMLQPSYWGK